MRNISIRSKVAGLIMLMVAFSSCDAVLEQDKTEFGKGPILAQFAKASTTAKFLQDGKIQTYNYPLTIIGGNNEPINEPVTVTISVDPSSTAVSGKEYTLEKTTYTIPAGEMSVNAEVKVITANLDSFNAKTLVLKVESSSKGVSDRNKAKIVLQAVCPLNLNSFLGNYTSTTGTSSKTSVITLGAQPNTLLITTGAEKILIELNPDPVNGTITFVPKGAVLSNNATYGPVWATTIEADASNYNSCDMSMDLEFKSCVGAGCFGGTTVKTLVKQ